MNVDKLISDTSPCKVISKYFASKTGMDESLLDFQEKKKIAAPKRDIKPTVNKPKSKRSTIRLRGQKDVRTILQSKKNELVSYTKHFDTVCKQSGIDVDSEQLQLAVALSKSLQPIQDNDTETTKNSLQKRTVKIRTTLQEYGFTVPEIKITNVNKKLKKHKIDYKLLLLTEAQKQQIISNKYSEVLFQNLDCSKCTPNKKKACANDNAKLYYLSTNAAYNLIKDNELFYINLPLEKSSNKGSLLKNWEDIPGRPISPKPTKKFTMDVSEIDCSQNELDIILSGTLKCVKHITKLKIKEVPSVELIVNSEAKDNSHMNPDINIKDNEGGKVKYGTVKKGVGRIISDGKIEDSAKVENQIEFQGAKLKSSQTVRSDSPDLFEDEIPSMLINFKDTTKLSENMSISKLHNIHLQVGPVDCEENSSNIREILPNSSEAFSSVESENIDLKLCQSNVTKRSNDDMEITKCIGTSLNHASHCGNKSLLGADKTKIKANDFMDLTECVLHSSYKNMPKIATDLNIDLTQKCDDDYNVTTVELEPEKILTENSFNKNIETMDLTQSSNSNDDLPFIQVSGTNKTLEDTVILNDNDFNTIIRLPRKGTLENEVIIINENNDEGLLDLVDVTPKNIPNGSSSCSSSFDEFLYDHSDNVDNEDSGRNLNNISSLPIEEQRNEIDLTQSTSSCEVHERSNNSLTDNDKELCNKSSLGKIDDLSIDYDEVILNQKSISNSNIPNVSNSHVLFDNNDEKQMEISTQSGQEHVSFEISDRKLDYSLHKSYFEQPEVNFGGISIMDDISHVKIVDSHETVSNHNFEGTNVSFLPPVNIKSSNDSQTSISEIKTPCKDKDNYGTVKTPSNKEYFVKTDEVTPMLDFTSMSTPERNQELDKYGLKPLKRKRAIQLLTHIYNQTHPIIETCSNEELQSSSKKRKSETSVYKSQELEAKNKTTSPRNRSVADQLDIVMENIYETTNETVDVRNVECDADDWIFQKREKAIVHSCRVPLHIAFYNYVSTRRLLREAILRYEPVNIDVIHKDLVANGFKYDPKDLLKFLDKKCITVKTADNSSRNRR